MKSFLLFIWAVLRVDLNSKELLSLRYMLISFDITWYVGVFCMKIISLYCVKSTAKTKYYENEIVIYLCNKYYSGHVLVYPRTPLSSTFRMNKMNYCAEKMKVSGSKSLHSVSCKSFWYTVKGIKSGVNINENTVSFWHQHYGFA